MGTALAQRKERFSALKGWLSASKGALAMALPRHMTPDRMMRIALSAASRNPRLLECTPESICLALIIASEVGLEPNGREAHLIPYKNKNKNVYEAQFQADYKGLVQLAYRSGQVASFHASAVHAKDDFDYSFGTGAFLRHRPSRDEDPGELVAAYAIAALKGGGEKFVVLMPSDVLKRRAASQGYRSAVQYGSDDNPWMTNAEAMWAKSAAKELVKWIPASPELQRAAAADDLADMGSSQVAMIDLTGELTDDEVTAALSQAPDGEQKKIGTSPLNSRLESNHEVHPPAPETEAEASDQPAGDPLANLRASPVSKYAAQFGEKAFKAIKAIKLSTIAELQGHLANGYAIKGLDTDERAKVADVVMDLFTEAGA